MVGIMVMVVMVTEGITDIEANLKGISLKDIEITHNAAI